MINPSKSESVLREALIEAKKAIEYLLDPSKPLPRTDVEQVIKTALATDIALLAEIASTNAAYSLADLRSDAGDQEAADAINFGAALADQRWKFIKKLAWACRETNGRKRAAALKTALAELPTQYD